MPNEQITIKNGILINDLKLKEASRQEKIYHKPILIKLANTLEINGGNSSHLNENTTGQGVIAS